MCDLPLERDSTVVRISWLAFPWRSKLGIEGKGVGMKAQKAHIPPLMMRMATKPRRSKMLAAKEIHRRRLQVLTWSFMWESPPLPPDESEGPSKGVLSSALRLGGAAA